MLSVCPSAPQAKIFGILRCGNVFFAFQNGVFCSVLHPKSPKIFGLRPNCELTPLVFKPYPNKGGVNSSEYP